LKSLCYDARSEKHQIMEILIWQCLGPTKGNQLWRIKSNEELDKLIKHKNIVNCIKTQRLIWFGHVQRMPDTRTVKKIFKWKLLTKRSQGRPKYRWKDNIKRLSLNFCNKLSFGGNSNSLVTPVRT